MSWFSTRKCFGCAKPHGPNGNFQTCSRCKGAEYCSINCQKQDFSRHKSRCKKLGALLTKFLSSFMSDDQREFVLKENAGMDIWNKMDQEAKQDHLVHLVRDIQSIVGIYVELAHSKESMFPVEKALLWLNRSLKIAAYHTEYFPAEKDSEDEDMMDTDNQDKENSVGNCNTINDADESSENTEINTTKNPENGDSGKDRLLHFGGDWDDGRKGVEVKHNKSSCSSSKGFPSDIYNCEYFARRAALLENSPSGLADPFFCFGGRFNIPEVYVLMGKHQEAIDYINHWADPQFWSERSQVKGARVERFNEWQQGKHSNVNMYQYFDVEEHLFDGEEESKVLLRIYGIIMLVRLHAIKNIPKLKKERQKVYQVFLLGTHSRVGEESAVLSLAGVKIPLMRIHKYVVADPCESVAANEDYIYYCLNTHIRLSADCMYLMTGDERFMSRRSMIGFSCSEHPERELVRLVWHLFHKLSTEEATALGQAYRRICDDLRSW